MKLFGIFIGAKGPPTYLNSEHEKELKGYLSRSSDPSTRLVLADVLAAQYVRLGLAGEAKSLFEGLNLDDYVDDDETVTLTNQLLSISYTSLTRGDALNPYEWGFERDTSRLDRARLADFGFQFDSRGYLTDIASPDLVAERISRPMDNALGFYIANWFSLQMVARSEGPSVVDSAEIHMELLRSFVRKGALPRQVWNFCFIAGLQLHRKGLAVENANNEFQLRNKFFEVCVDASLGLPRDQIKRLEDLESDDPVPICMAILLRSEPSLSSLVQQAKIGSVEQLSQLSRSIRPPLVVRRAADQFRLLRGEESVTPQIWDLYAADDNTLGIYLTPIPEIKNSLLAR